MYGYKYRYGPIYFTRCLQCGKAQYGTLEELNNEEFFCSKECENLWLKENPKWKSLTY